MMRRGGTMIKRLLARVGVGTAKVRTELAEKTIERGKEIKGDVYIHGGELKQNISRIKVHIDSNFHKDDDTSTQFRDITDSVVDFSIKGIGNVNPNEEKIVPFSFSLPYYTPITFQDQKVKVRTKLITNFMNPPSDSQYIVVTDQWLEKILDYLTSHGYEHTHKSGMCRHRKRADDNPTLFLQTFILVNEVGTEIKFAGNEEDIHLYINYKNQIRHFPIFRNEDLDKRLEELTPHLLSEKSIEK